MTAALHPHSIEAERAILGGIMQRPDMLHVVEQHLSPEDFWRDDHRELFKLLQHMAAASEAIDLVTVPERVLRTKSPNRYGGVAYVIELVEHCPSPASLPSYCETVRQKAVSRRLMSIGASLTAMASSEDPDIEEKSGALLGDLIGAVTRTAAKGPPQTITQVMDDEQRRYEEGRGGIEFLPTGILGLDGALGGGLPKGQVTIICGHPSHGKSAVTLAIAGNIATRHCDLVRKCYAEGRQVDLSRVPGVAIFSLEMDRFRVFRRIAGSLSGVDHKVAAARKMSAVEAVAWDDACDRLSGAPMFIEDARRMTVSELRARALYIHHRLKSNGFEGLSLIVLDYIQKVSPADRKQPKHEAVADMSEAIYQLTQQIGCASAVLAQPNREARKTSDPRPRLWQLADSAALERDTDVALMVYWPAKHDPELTKTSERHRYEIEIAKNRDGQSGPTVPVHYTPRGMVFRDPSDEEMQMWAAEEKRRSDRGQKPRGRKRAAKVDAPTMDPDAEV